MTTKAPTKDADEIEEFGQDFLSPLDSIGADSSTHIEELNEIESFEPEKKETKSSKQDEEITKDSKTEKKEESKKEEKRSTNKIVDEFVAEPAKKEEDLPGSEEGVDNIEVDPIVPAMTELLEERWNFSINEEHRPKDFDGFVDLIEQIIDANTKHEFFNEDSQRFDEFLKNGGDPRVFARAIGEEKIVEGLDPKNEEHQKDIVTTYYQKKGMEPDEIQRALKRLERDEEMAEEAEAVHPKLEKIIKKEKDELLKKQEEFQSQQRQAVLDYENGVIEQVEKLETLFGTKITAKEKAELLPFILKKNQKGITPIQEAYQKDPYGFSVITAYAYLNKDKIFDKMVEPAKGKALEKLREKQKDLFNSKKHVTEKTIERQNTSFLDEMTEGIV